MTPDNNTKGLTTKKFVDPITGKFEVRYFWKRNPVYKVALRGKLVEQLAGYTLIHKDLTNALRWFRRAEELVPETTKRDGHSYSLAKDRETFDLVKGLFVAALTFYGKCFTQAQGRKAQIPRDWIGAEYRKTHDEYMKYRHNFAAHSGDERLEMAETFLLVNPKKAREILPYLTTVRFQPDVMLPSAPDKKFVELVEHLLAQLHERHDALAEKILSELILPKGNEFWHQAAKRGQPVTLDLPSAKRR